MSALGHKRTYAVQKGMSALHRIATVEAGHRLTGRTLLKATLILSAHREFALSSIRLVTRKIEHCAVSRH